MAIMFIFINFIQVFILRIFLKKIEKYDISSFTKICLIRDPIQRFISAYTNRVMHHKELSIDKMKAHNLDPEMANPNFVKYVRKFKTYRKFNL